MTHDPKHNGGQDGEIKSIVDRLERLDEERRALASDMKDVLDAGSEATGISKAAFRNILRERRRTRSEVHATYSDMDKIRVALRMRDPLDPLDDDESPGLMNEEPAAVDHGDFKSLGEALGELHRCAEERVVDSMGVVGA